MREAQDHEPLREGSKPRRDSGAFQYTHSDDTTALPITTGSSKRYLMLRQPAAVTDTERTKTSTHDTRAAVDQRYLRSLYAHSRRQ